MRGGVLGGVRRPSAIRRDQHSDRRRRSSMRILPRTEHHGGSLEGARGQVPRVHVRRGRVGQRVRGEGVGADVRRRRRVLEAVGARTMRRRRVVDASIGVCVASAVVALLVRAGRISRCQWRTIAVSGTAAAHDLCRERRRRADGRRLRRRRGRGSAREAGARRGTAAGNEHRAEGRQCVEGGEGHRRRAR